MKEITYIKKYTSQLEESDIQNFLDVFTRVYGEEDGRREKFIKKFMNNIYGDSLHLYAFADNKCVGTQFFWRNDIDGVKAFYSVDSATDPDYRGNGIFSKMVKLGLEEIGDDTLVYGTPNNNSLPAFQKLGWRIGARNKYQLLSKKTRKLLPIIDDEYFLWMAEGNDHLALWKKNGEWYVLKKRQYNVYLAIGIIDGRLTSDNKMKELEVVHCPLVLVYSPEGWWGNGMIRILSPTSLGEFNMPVYKIDTLM